MTAAKRFHVEGVAFWAPVLPDWDAARAAFTGTGVLQAPARRPAPEMLAPAERRRASDSVALALEVASAAARTSGRAARELPSIFTSAHGDLAINDYMCATLASAPAAISPTKFHNSVHNAPAGYWTIGTECRAASTALTAYTSSFAAGLLEAASQCAADGEAVLLVAFDVASSGALASVTRSEGLLATALVLAPAASERTLVSFEWELAGGAPPTLELKSEAARALAGNAMADALPFLEALAALVDGTGAPIGDAPRRSETAAVRTATLGLPLSATLWLRLRGSESALPAAGSRAG